MTTPRHGPIVVIGGGISGLTCAERLRRAGADVLCLEASARPGGALRSYATDGFVVEAGASTVLETPELARLVSDVGLGDELLHADRKRPRYILRAGVLHALPTDPIALIRTRMLSGRAKWRLVREPWIAARAETDEESVASFVRRRFGVEIAQTIAAPFVAGTFAGDAERLSARAVLPRLVDLEVQHGSVIKGMLRAAWAGSSGRPSLISFREGTETLPRRLGECLGDRLRMGTTVHAIRRDQSGSWIVSAVSGTSPAEMTASAIVLAAPAAVAARLLGEPCASAAATLSGLESASVALVSLAWPRSQISHSLGGIGFLVAPGESVRVLGCLWPASTFAGRAPRDQALLTAFVGGALDPRGALLDDAALVETVRSDLANVLGVTGPPRVLGIDRHIDALPQYGIGHAERMARAGRAIDSVPGLFACGNYFSGASVGECIRAAHHTSEKVLRSLA